MHNKQTILNRIEHAKEEVLKALSMYEDTGLAPYIEIARHYAKEVQILKIAIGE